MAIWEFTDYSTKDLRRALRLYGELEDLGLSFVDDEATREMEAELEKRENKE